MNSWFVFGIVAALFAAAAAATVVAMLGVYRFHFALNRMHSASIIDTLALFFVVVGLIISVGEVFSALKLLLILIFMWVGSPISSHLVSKLEVLTDSELSKHLTYIDTTRKED